MSKLDETNANNVQVGSQLPAISNFNQKALPMRWEYQNFNQSQSKNLLGQSAQGNGVLQSRFICSYVLFQYSRVNTRARLLSKSLDPEKTS